MSSKHREKTWSAAAETDVIMTTGWNLMSLQVTSVGVGGQFTFEGSNDGGATWVSISAIKIDGTRITPVIATGFYFIPATFDTIRITLSALTSGTPKTALTLRDSALADLLIALGAGSGDASAANQATMIAVLGATTGAKVTTDSNGTIQQYLRGLVTQAASLLTQLGTLVFGAGTAASAQRVTLASDDPGVSVLGATSGAKVTTDVNGTIQQYLRGAVTQLATLIVNCGTFVFGTGTSAAAQRVVIANDDALMGAVNETAPASDTASSGHNGRLQRIAQRLSTLITNLGTLVFGAGTAAAAQRVTLASDDPGVAVLGATSGAKVITDSNGTIQQYLRGAVTQLASLLTQLGTIAYGTGAASTAQRTVLADDGGVISVGRLMSAAATTNATNVKASAGTVFSIRGYNTVGTTKYVKLYNKATAPTVGTDVPILVIGVAAGGPFHIEFANGRYFSTGIGYSLQGGVADNDTTALAAADIVAFHVEYR